MPERATLLKKRFQQKCFPVNIFEEHMQTTVSAGVLFKFSKDTNIH